jgi:hypothetical protein
LEWVEVPHNFDQLRALVLQHIKSEFHYQPPFITNIWNVHRVSWGNELKISGRSEVLLAINIHIVILIMAP